MTTDGREFRRSEDDASNRADAFEQAWQRAIQEQGPPPPIRDFLPIEDASARLDVLELLVAIDLERRWRRRNTTISLDDSTDRRSETASTLGPCPKLEQYVACFPELALDRLPLELVLCEYQSRWFGGDRPSLQEYLKRFPQYAEALPSALRGIHEQLSRESDRSTSTTPLPQIPGYELLEKIGQGGMGVVFKARQIELDRIVALKMIRIGPLASDEDIRRFYAEAQAAAHLDHPGIVPVFDVGEQDGQPFFAMGYVEGQALSQVTAKGPLAPRHAAELSKRVAEAVAFAHERGLLHRDLKPANILLPTPADLAPGATATPESAWIPKITDFGLAKRLEGESSLTATGQILGTPSYMSPEQAAGDSLRLGPATVSSQTLACLGLALCV
jgi:tRNA A-37 threonylcarbamoyl transferase component Bud32